VLVLHEKIGQINSKADFFQLVQSLQEQFTGVHRKLAVYAMNHFIDVAFMTAQQWAAEVGTSEVSAVIKATRILPKI
jgi:DNA-binding MurR/RpiR family transcriptional regulator